MSCHDYTKSPEDENDKEFFTESKNNSVFFSETPENSHRESFLCNDFEDQSYEQFLPESLLLFKEEPPATIMDEEEGEVKPRPKRKRRSTNKSSRNIKAVVSRKPRKNKRSLDQDYLAHGTGIPRYAHSIVYLNLKFEEA